MDKRMNTERDGAETVNMFAGCVWQMCGLGSSRTDGVKFSLWRWGDGWDSVAGR